MNDSPSRRNRPGRGFSRLAFALALCAPVAAACPASARCEDTSLLAVGDTGGRHALPFLREGQRSVARGMDAVDAEAPVDALVLLGDLFYPDGLRTRELAQRVRDNVVLPYCRFVDLDGGRFAEVAAACDRPGGKRHPVPIYAVAGNHDYDSRESPELEHRVLREFVSNWHMQDGAASVVELAPGVSLVLVDTPAVIRSGDFQAIHAALREARGPWRIVAAHLPVAPGDPTADAEWQSPVPPLEHFSLPDAPVQLYLAGHRHSLQVIEGTAPGPALHVIAGSGATIRPVRSRYDDRRVALERTGFVRVDRACGNGGPRLVVSLYTTPRFPFVFWEPPRLASRWSVDLAGRVSALPVDSP